MSAAEAPPLRDQVAGPVPVLEVRQLRIELEDGAPVVDDVSLQVGTGEALGVVGESGSGKTTMALSLLGYSRPGVRLRGGTILVDGQEVIGAGARDLRRLRGRIISYVPQEPGAAINPALRLRTAIGDVLRAHGRESDEDIVGTTLQSMQLPSMADFSRRYPHQLSGGQQQRVSIAMAAACEPRVLVLDEPTTALDVVTQARILAELARLRREHSIAMIYVSHDLSVVAGMADHVAVMYAGRVVEHGPTTEIIRKPRHPYTRALVAAIPDYRHPRRPQGIPGVTAGVGQWPTGCPFEPRCEHAVEECGQAVPPIERADGLHTLRCVRWRTLPPYRAPAPPPAALRDSSNGSVLLRVTSLTAHYQTRRGSTTAVDQVSLELPRGRCVALVGESGSGKTTIARCVAGLHEPSGGSIELDGTPLAATAGKRSREQRRRIQIIFQNPYSSLNPRHLVGDAVARPARILGGRSEAEARADVLAVLERVRLPARVVDRYPGELSGGERQRVAIARALAAGPELLVCDEITSALDVSVQAAVLDLLAELQTTLGLSLLFITHDLGVVACVADQVLVLEHGAVRERGDVSGVLANPHDDYTRALMAAAPSLSKAPSTVLSDA
ncbi:MAG: ABC transporter ATP-binding protein [Solirubrobacteraceae bacterium]